MDSTWRLWSAIPAQDHWVRPTIDTSMTLCGKRMNWKTTKWLLCFRIVDLCIARSSYDPKIKAWRTNKSISWHTRLPSKSPQVSITTSWGEWNTRTVIFSFFFFLFFTGAQMKDRNWWNGAAKAQAALNHLDQAWPLKASRLPAGQREAKAKLSDQ